MNILINENIYKSSNITVYGLATYCSLKSLLANNETKQVYVNPDVLSYQLVRTLKCSRRFVDSIKIGLGELISNNLVRVIESKGGSYVLDCSKLLTFNKDEYYTIITYDELLRIFRLDSKHKFSILRYFIFIIGSLNKNIDVWIDESQHKTRVVGTLVIDCIAQLCGISKSSAIRYNQILEDANLIYIKRTEDVIRCPNVYGRPEDKEYIDAYAKSQKEKILHTRRNAKC